MQCANSFMYSIWYHIQRAPPSLQISQFGGTAKKISAPNPGPSVRRCLGWFTPARFLDFFRPTPVRLTGLIFYRLCPRTGVEGKKGRHVCTWYTGSHNLTAIIAIMLFTAASRGFPAIDGFLVFPRVRVRVRVREALNYGALSYDSP